MPTFLSKVFKPKSSAGPSPLAKGDGLNGVAASPLQKPRWEDAWARKDVEPEEVQGLLRACTREVKSRALTVPFMLLPFRPDCDTSAARTFIRNYFDKVARMGRGPVQDEELNYELRLTEPVALCCILKWCWSRLPGGVVTWEAYELFKVGEQDSGMARDSFATFIPLSVDSDARTKIIFDFFDLMAAIAAHGKTNGFGGRKLSRLAGWWAFTQTDSGNGFDGGYESWAKAADATSHLFFAYLRSLSPDAAQGSGGILTLPRSLQSLLQATEYPPRVDPRLLNFTTKVVMIVNAVSPTPFALLRRAKNFEYRDDDRALRAFSDYDDPVRALTDECQRVIKAISSANRSQAFIPKAGSEPRDESWSRFEDMGFSSLMDSGVQTPGSMTSTTTKHQTFPPTLSAAARSRVQDHGRPVTPSWADFLSTGFAEDASARSASPLLLPPDKVLPPIGMSRAQSSQSARPDTDGDLDLEPGELASINNIMIDDSFWWVWIISLAAEEPPERKSVFGRCAVIETHIAGGRWLVMEEKVKGAAALPAEGAHIVEKRSRFGLTKRARAFRGKSSSAKSPEPVQEMPYGNTGPTPPSKVSIGPDQHARIQAAAATLQQRQRQQNGDQTAALRRARTDDVLSTKTNSVFTLQPMIFSEAAPAMKWANKFDKDAIREAYLANGTDAQGQNGNASDVTDAPPSKRPAMNGAPAQSMPNLSKDQSRGLPPLPQNEEAPPPLQTSESSGRYSPLTPLTPPPPFASASALQQPTKQASPLASESTTPVGEKPLPAADNTLPFSRQEPPSRFQDPVLDLRTIAESPDSSPEAKKPGKKLQKQNQGAFKRLFGKKKATQPVASPPATDVFDSPTPEPQDANLGRSLPDAGKPTSPEAIAPQEPPVTQPLYPPTNGFRQAATASRDSVVSALEPEPQVEAKMPRGPQNMQPVTGTNEDYFGDAQPSRPAETPYHNAPAVIPEPPRNIIASPFADHTPESDVGKSRDDAVSEPSIELNNNNNDATPPLDRWAQIRKNAAQRAAARQSEDMSGLSQSVRTEDGETSGEETIESRVARIKARVAELTGNMDEQNGGRRPSLK